jgi:hypothetical protein
MQISESARAASRVARFFFDAQIQAESVSNVIVSENANQCRAFMVSRKSDQVVCSDACKTGAGERLVSLPWIIITFGEKSVSALILRIGR